MKHLFFISLFLICAVNASDLSTMDRTRVIFDCGSSGVKTMVFACGTSSCPTPARTGQQCTDSSTSTPVTKDCHCKGMKVQNLPTLVRDDTLANKFATYIATLVAGKSAETIFTHAYATAGNRIITNEEDQTVWNLAVNKALNTVNMNHIGGFHTLHGTEEAMVEFLAIKFWNDDPTSNLDGLRLMMDNAGNEVWPNMISLGGASAQMAIDLDTPQKIKAFFELVSAAEQLNPAMNCNRETQTSDYITVGIANDGGSFKFGTATAEEQCFPKYYHKDKTHRANPKLEGNPRTRRCVGFISFLSGQFIGRDYNTASCTPDLVRLLGSTDKCYNHVWGGLDQIESLYKAVYEPTTCDQATNSWSEFIHRDCFARLVATTLKSGPWNGAQFTAAGTFRTSLTKSFRCVQNVRETIKSYFLPSDATVVAAENSGDWTLGIAKIFSCHTQCAFANNGVAGSPKQEPTCSKTIGANMLEELSLAIDYLL